MISLFLISSLAQMPIPPDLDNEDNDEVEIRISYGDVVRAALGDRTIEGAWTMAGGAVSSFCSTSGGRTSPDAAVLSLSWQVVDSGPFAVHATLTSLQTYLILEGGFALNEHDVPILTLEAHIFPVTPGQARTFMRYDLEPDGSGWKGTRRILWVLPDLTGCFDESQVTLRR